MFAGSQVRFTVAGITGAGALTYKWQRDGVDLSGGGGVSNPTANTLTISSVGKTNEGTYTCVVSNTAGATNTSNAVQLTVRKSLFLLFCLIQRVCVHMCACVCICVRVCMGVESYALCVHV